jgi:transposase
MKLTDFARHLPEEVWHLFQPLLPPVVWCGNGRPPASNSDCLQAVFSVLASGIAWRMLPTGFPSYKTGHRRRKVWLQRETLRTAWHQLAQRYDALQGLNGAPRLLDGSKKPSKKGATRRDRAQSSAASAGQPCTEPVMPAPCRWGPWARAPTPTPGGTPRRSYSAWWCGRRWQSSVWRQRKSGAVHTRQQMAPTAIGRHRSGPDVREFACQRPHAAWASLGSARCAMPSSVAIIFLPNLGGYAGVSTGQPATTWHGSKWLPVSSCSAQVLSHSP